jgi:predicted nuclease with RNAse H fold
MAATTWLGVDVGGKRKRFDYAVIDRTRVVELRGRASLVDVLDAVREYRPKLVAIDSPRSAAPDGYRSREGEHLLVKAVCGIRWTPDAAKLQVGDYYEWIREGLAPYEALELAGIETIEVFPTASWTRWFGERGVARRSTWTRAGIAELRLAEIPKRTNQDQRDAVAAALTARHHTDGRTERFGDIVVPRAGLPT